jgi:hypothetical protein
MPNVTRVVESGPIECCLKITGWMMMSEALFTSRPSGLITAGCGHHE